MIDPKDLEHCREAIRTGSLSFHAASKILPASVRAPALALYAFCRLADDEVDEGDQKTGAVLRLQERLDADERRYADLSGVRDYSARVASAVGAMMCVLMRPDALVRACDLGVAMQLTNIACDVGEDARMGRIYLPMDWLAEAGIDPLNFTRDPLPDGMVKRLLAEAQRLYVRSEAGINVLPLKACTGIWGARLVYAGIGSQIRQQGYDTISMRAHTSKAQKIGWLMQAGLRAGVSTFMPKSAVIYAKPLHEVQFLVDAASHRVPDAKRSHAVLDILADLKARDAAGIGSGSQQA